MGSLLSAFCDGEAAVDEAAALSEHLRACAGCRATLRAYRAAPRAAAALAPALPLARPLLERAHDAVAGLSLALHGASATDSALSQVAAAGGTRGAGMAALAKVLAICVGTAGGAAACVATGVVPAPLAIGRGQVKAPVLERRIDPSVESEWSGDAGVGYEPEPQPTSPQPAPEPAGPPGSHPFSRTGCELCLRADRCGGIRAACHAGGRAVERRSSSGSSAGSAAGEFGP